jgi:hypothetical protein
VAANPRATILAELAAEFVEERVRQLPASAFGVNDVTRAVASMLRDAGDCVALGPGDDKWMADWLDQHPFLLRSKAGSTTQWKPGFNKGTRRG